MRRVLAPLLAVFVLTFAACGDDSASPDDRSDAGADTAGDVGVDVPGDAEDDAHEDVASDVGADFGSDSGDPDVETDADATGADATSDASDAGQDVPPSDGGDIDTGADVGADAVDVADVADTDADETPLYSCSDIAPGEWDEGVTLVFDPSAIGEDTTAFDFPVQSGSAHPEDVLLWAHIADSFDKTLYVWRESDVEGEVVLVHAERVSPGSAGYTHVRVAGLAPCTWYSYAFFSGTEEGGFTGRSVIGRFKTAHPVGSLDPVVVAATSCTSQSYQPWTALQNMAARDFDLFVHLGDQSYNDDAETLAEYRAAWRTTLNDPGYRAIHPRASHLSTWDDHEVTNNWNPETISDARRIHAYDAYFETLAVDRGPDDRLWYSYRWGDTVEFFVTDNRGERRPSTRRSDDAQYISPEQMTWLQDGLLNSEAHFKVVFSSVPITNMPGVWDLSPEDRWEGYAADRNRLLDFITGNDIDNVWFLGGDFHIGWVGRVEPEGERSNYWEIAVGPGGNGPNPLAWALSAPQFPFKTDGLGNSFQTMLEFDPIRDAVRVLFTDAGGDVLYDQWLSWGG